LITWLKGFPLTRVAFEPSGADHRAFERRWAAAGLPLVKVNPRQARRCAEAIGRQAKLVLGPASGRTRGTDAVDAAMGARFAALLEPSVRPVVSATLDAMKELQGARRALLKDRVAAQNRGHTHRLPRLKRQAAEHLRQIDRQLAAIDAARRAQLEADPALQARFEILVRIPGVGDLTALALLVEMPSSAPARTKARRASPASPRARAPQAGTAASGPSAAPRPPAPGALPAGPGRGPLHRRDDGQVRRPPRRRPAAQGRAGHDHAHAPDPRQRPPPRPPNLVPTTRLTITDTLAMRAARPLPGQSLTAAAPGSADPAARGCRTGSEPDRRLPRGRPTGAEVLPRCPPGD
jgi:transposase